MLNDELPIATRLWFAWLCFFKVLFDGGFAARAWGAREPLSLPAPGQAGPGAPKPLPSGMQPSRPPAPSREVTSNAALQLLALLQREGRLVDFLQQDIASFGDADVGVAARVVHEGCRRALRAHAAVEAVRPESEGARVTLPAGFSADEVKLLGDVKGPPPYAGVVRHRGWRASAFALPEVLGEHDFAVLAPAEIEVA